MSCAICSEEVKDYPNFFNYKRVTSDAKPWPSGGALGVCRQCGVVQKRVDQKWLKEISEIYSDYDVYYQSEGQEQVVFDIGSSLPRKRSSVLLDFIKSSGANISQHGKILDYGCANGEFLSVFSKKYPAYSLSGFDLSRKYENALQKLPKFERLYQEGELPSHAFDVISLIHTLEHLVTPIETLKSIQHALKTGGVLFIQVPNLVRSPFDLVIADHLLHFSPETLSDVLSRAGFEIIALSTDAVYKEISVLAVPAMTSQTIKEDFHQAQKCLEQHMKFLDAVLEGSQQLAERSSFGIFGTSISGTWLYSYYSQRVSFFVDEDATRIHRHHFGLPIYAPQALPSSEPVYVPLMEASARSVIERCASENNPYHGPVS